MDKEHFIATLQACYFGDRNAFNEIVRIYDDMKQRIDKAVEYIEKSKLNQLDTYCKYLHINFSTETIENLDELLNILKGDDTNE